MPWARFEDDYLSNMKLATLSTSAICLDMAAIVHSARELRDGVLTKADLQTVAALIHLKRWESASAELVRVNRWAIGPDGGYLIHDYLDYQPSRQQVLEERAAAAERMRRIRSPEVRNKSGRSSPEVREKFALPVPGPGPVPGPERSPNVPGTSPQPPPQAAGEAPPNGAHHGSSNGTAVDLTPRKRPKRTEPPAELACCPDFARTGSEHWAHCRNAPQETPA